MGYALELGDHQVIGLTDGFNALEIFFWYFNAALFFKSHNEFNKVETVCVEVVTEASLFGYFCCID